MLVPLSGTVLWYFLSRAATDFLKSNVSEPSFTCGCFHFLGLEFFATSGGGRERHSFSSVQFLRSTLW